MSDSGDPRQSTWITPLRIRTDLGLSIAAAPNPIVFGNEVTITLRVENFGPSNSDGFSVELQLPDEVSFDSSLDNCSPDTGGAVCGSSFIEVGSSIDVRVVLTFPESFAGPIFGDARVYPDNIDQVDENDSASVLIPIDRPFFFDNFEDGTLDAWSSIFPTP
ncbi:MAG: CARDB domain-containing protein [Acidobacteriota bacterium]